jgi:FdhD protein
MKDRERIKLLRLDSGRTERVYDQVAVEEILTLRLDGVEIVSLLYTPLMAEELALGFMLSEGYITGADDVGSLEFSEGTVDVGLKKPLAGLIAEKVRVMTSGCGGGITFTYPKGLKQLRPVKRELAVPADEILSACSEFRKSSKLFETTGGVHSAALYRGIEQTAFAEDIGRHNAVDKVFGYCLKAGIETADAMLLSTGRISSEILVKCVKRGVTHVVSRGAPTSLAVELAGRFGVTLIGFARGRRMNVYTNEEGVDF